MPKTYTLADHYNSGMAQAGPWLEKHGRGWSRFGELVARGDARKMTHPPARAYLLGLARGIRALAA